MTYVMRDHPGWDNNGDTWLRAANTGSGDIVVLTATSAARTPCAMDTFTPPAQWPSTLPTALADALTSVGALGRWASPGLWDAIATAIIRQVIRADQARVQHQRLRHRYGPAIQTSTGHVHALPSPETVAHLRPEDFRQLGMAFKAKALSAAASAFLEHRTKWMELTPHRLMEELQTVPRIGPWTAGAAVADYTNDWSLYPHGDLAVRTWARTAAPEIDWPTTEHEFAEHWRNITGPQLGPVTLFTLAWGARHAERLAQPSDP
jgi:DNA-3-methyladenine glycosylase II